MEEIWEYIDDFPEYSVSNLGRVINIRCNRMMRLNTTDRGYKTVSLHNDWMSCTTYVHQLVASIFIEEYRKGLRVTHIDDDYSNNAVTNLRVLSGTLLWESEYASPRLNARRVMIVETGQTFRSVHTCARYICGRASNIYRCLNGVRQTHMGYHFEYIEVED